MNITNTKRIIEACPSLFRDIHQQRENMMNNIVFSPIAFGFECGDGWADILVELCEKIQLHLNTLDEESRKHIIASQVKEKYGTLRFYIDASDDTIEDLIEEAVEKSSKTCEICGKPGKTITDGYWLSTVCEEHDK